MGWVTEFRPDPEGLARCVQCGLCLPVCPTFRLTGRETASPRGRLQAMTAVQDRVATVDAKFEEIIDFCLGCRACEPVCPGMVPYGGLLEGTRTEIAAQRRSLSRTLRGWVLGRLLPSRRLLRFGTSLLALIQRLHLSRVVPPRLRRRFSGLRVLGPSADLQNGTKPERGSTSVGLLTGCVQDAWFSAVNVAAADLLTRAGYQLVVPEGQTCCGALAAHDGHASSSARLVEQNRLAFVGCDLVVATAAGCSAHLHDHWENASDITVVIAEAIDNGLLPTLAPTQSRVVVQDPCHLRHAQGVYEAPRSIVRAAGYKTVDIDDDGLCCGAAGLYTILQPEASAQLGASKASLIRSTGITKVASANPGCEMQLRSFLGPDHEVLHPIELYLDAIRADEQGTNVALVESGID